MGLFGGQPTGNYSQQIQEILGARPAASGGRIQDILSARLTPTADDRLSAFGESYISRKPINAESYASNRFAEQLAPLRAVQILATGNQGGGAINAAADRLMQENPGMSFSTALSIAKSGVGVGNAYMNGGIQNIPNAPQAFANIEGAKRDAINNSDIAAAAPKGFNKKTGEGAGATIIANEQTATNLDMLDASLTQIENLLPQVTKTGPIMGRVGDAAKDPNYENLQGAINAVVLQAKELYNLGAGQGFSDADREFLQQVVAGKYSRAETISLAIQRMRQVVAKRREFVARQTHRMNAYSGGQPIAPIAIENSGPDPSNLPLSPNRQVTPSGIEYEIVE